MKRLAPLAGALGVALTAACLSGPNIGIDPPLDRLSFVTGLVLEGGALPDAPRCVDNSPCGADQACVQGRCERASNYLLAVNANSARDYNGSAISAFRLDRFLDATGLEGLARGPGAAIQPAGSPLSQDFPCRRDAVQSRVIECEESYFAEPSAGVALGVFAGQPAKIRRANGQRQILVPVRGEPSVTVVSIEGGQDSTSLRLQCAADPSARRCDSAHKLREVRDDSELGRLPLHPRSIVAIPDFSPPLALLSHDSRPELTLVGFENDRADSAMILESVRFFNEGQAGTGNSIGGGLALGGASDLSLYPCRSVQEGGNPPQITKNCQQPLVYASYRNRARVELLTVSDLGAQSSSRASCVRARAAGASTFACGVGARSIERFDVASIRPNSSNNDVFGDTAFLPDGSRYFMVQRRPGALLRYDTSIDPDTRMPRNRFAGAIDICANASDFVTYSGARTYGLLSCRDEAKVYLVDLDAFVLVKTIDLGASPSGMVADPVRKLVYIPTFMDAIIAVLDMDPERATQHSVIARLGLREELN